jgi:hypothetical protein
MSRKRRRREGTTCETRASMALGTGSSGRNDHFTRLLPSHSKTAMCLSAGPSFGSTNRRTLRQLIREPRLARVEWGVGGDTWRERTSDETVLGKNRIARSRGAAPVRTQSADRSRSGFASTRSRSSSISAGTCCDSAGPAASSGRIPMARRSGPPRLSRSTSSRPKRHAHLRRPRTASARSAEPSSIH